MSDDAKTYEIRNDGKSIVCMICGRESTTPAEVRMRYCRDCNLFHDDKNDPARRRITQMKLLGEQPRYSGFQAVRKGESDGDKKRDAESCPNGGPENPEDVHQGER